MTMNDDGPVDDIIDIGVMGVGAGVVLGVTDQALTQADRRSQAGEAHRHKVSKSTAGYVPQSRVLDESCENCIHFNSDRSCDLVSGDISPMGHSKLWEEG